MSNHSTQQPPSNGGEFLLSLLHNTQTPPQKRQSSQQPEQFSLITDPAIAAMGSALVLPSPPLPYNPGQQMWIGLNPQLPPPPPSPGRYFGNSIAIPGNQFVSGVNFGYWVLGDCGAGRQQSDQRFMFGWIPIGIRQFEGSRIGGFNGLDRDSQFLDHVRLNPMLGYRDFEQERIGNGFGNQFQSPNMRMPLSGFQREPVGVGTWDTGNKDKERGNRLSNGKLVTNEQSEGVRRMWNEDAEDMGDVGLSGQLDRPGPPAGSNLQPVLLSHMEDALGKLCIQVGGDVERKIDRREGVEDDTDDVAEKMLDSLLPEDESLRMNIKELHHKKFRSDPRGQQMLSQRMRNSKRQMYSRSDIDRFNIPFIKIYKSLIPAEEEKEKQKRFLMSLEKIILKEWPHAHLYVYGSCANSFGVSKSDIDVCLAFEDMDVEKSEALLKLAEMLESSNLQNVQALTRARIPIVKLMDPVTGLYGDICINNVLAVVNTKLLRDYSQIDVRLHQLAFIVKHWAKRRGVNETYQGTLSSYAYVLMCIHFLQQRKPAILPCLQRLDTTFSVTVNGIQCAFFDQVEKLRSFGSHNQESIAQLVWGFFNYWAFCHDYANSVISIRTGSIICKREKDWTRRVGNDRHLICIEDPFETSHDLGRVVDRRSIKVLREEFERAADIMQSDPRPFVTLFESYVH